MTESPVVYRCPVCGLTYAEQKYAQACEAWCRAHPSCNLEIIKHALPAADTPLQNK